MALHPTHEPVESGSTVNSPSTDSLQVPSTPLLARLPPEIHLRIGELATTVTSWRLAMTNKYFQQLLPARKSARDLDDAEKELDEACDQTKKIRFPSYHRLNLLSGGPPPLVIACYRCLRLRPQHNFEVYTYVNGMTSQWTEEWDEKFLPKNCRTHEQRMSLYEEGTRRLCMTCSLDTSYGRRRYPKGYALDMCDGTTKTICKRCCALESGNRRPFRGLCRACTTRDKERAAIVKGHGRRKTNNPYTKPNAGLHEDTNDVKDGHESDIEEERPRMKKRAKKTPDDNAFPGHPRRVNRV